MRSDGRMLTAGLLITYTIMLGDVLVGKAPEYNGFITNLVDAHSGDIWYLDRRFVVRSAALIIGIGNVSFAAWLWGLFQIACMYQAV